MATPRTPIGAETTMTKTSCPLTPAADVVVALPQKPLAYGSTMTTLTTGVTHVSITLSSHLGAVTTIPQASTQPIAAPAKLQGEHSGEQMYQPRLVNTHP